MFFNGNLRERKQQKTPEMQKSFEIENVCVWEGGGRERVCVCVCVCKREREIERDREGGRERQRKEWEKR